VSGACAAGPDTLAALRLGPGAATDGDDSARKVRQRLLARPGQYAFVTKRITRDTSDVLDALGTKGTITVQ
jgi:hypothetical protein